MRAEGERVATYLWQKAREHPGHLCNGLCPDEGYMDSRDPECFYCSVLTLITASQPPLARDPEWPPSECVCAETSTRNCPVHQNAGDPEWPNLPKEC